MSTDNATKPSAGVSCGACNAANKPDAKFCVGCGQTLYEKCLGCTQQVLLTQKFCESCGADLEAVLKERRQKHQQYMADAVSAAREARFDRALGLLGRIAKNEDYRFADDVQKAGRAIEKIQQLQANAEAEIEEVLTKANQAYQSGDQPLTAQLLGTIPESMMTAEVKELLGKVQKFSKQLKRLDQDLRAAIAQKEWHSVGGIVDQLLERCPDDKRYRQVATQVGEKLLSNAQKLLSNGCYEKAVAKLKSMPELARSEAYQNLRNQANDLHWLSVQLEAEPIATPMLGRLGMRFAKTVPGDANPRKTVQQLADRLKSGPRDARSHFPAWSMGSESAFGGQVRVLTAPQSIDLGEHPAIKSAPGRFNVALGLAIQGLGRGRIEGQFSKKKGLLGGRSRRKSNVWGVDLGNASIKAVCLREIDGRLTVIDAFMRDYEAPLCRAGNEGQSSSLLGKVIKEFLDEKREGLQDAGVWCNLHPASLIVRSLRLPPVKVKQANELLTQEVEQKIPISMDELSIVRWIAGTADDKVHGRPALIAVARQQVVDDRLEQLNAFGLKVDGLQGDNLALVNFVSHEFSEEWSEQAGSQDEDKTPAVLLFDCGASVTNLVVVSSETQWAWTFESGGEDFTSRIATGMKTSHAEAEKFKQNPAEFSHPAEQYRVVEQRQDETRVRIDASIADALQQNKRLRVTQSFCCGGGCLSLGWIRRIMLSQS